jgi:hypothetical protein
MDRSPASVETVVQVKLPIQGSEGLPSGPESNSELCNVVDTGSEGYCVR